MNKDKGKGNQLSSFSDFSLLSLFFMPVLLVHQNHKNNDTLTTGFGVMPVWLPCSPCDLDRFFNLFKPKSTQLEKEDNNSCSVTRLMRDYSKSTCKAHQGNWYIVNAY